MKKFLSILTILALFSTLFSCNKEEDEFDYTAVKTMAGQWYVQFLDGSNADLLGGHTELLTSCTSSNAPDSLVIADLGKILGHFGAKYGFSFKTKIDLTAQTFAVANSQNNYYTASNGVYSNYNIKITVTEGKITNATKTLPSGNKADEISFKIEFSDDPGVKYTIKGYRVSGFLEDVPSDLLH
jgi:hypothetical protein